MAEYYSSVWIYSILCISLSIDGHLDQSCLLAILTSTIMNTCVLEFKFSSIYFQFFWIYIPRRGHLGSYGNSVFRFLRKHQTVLLVYIFHSTYHRVSCRGHYFAKYCWVVLWLVFITHLPVHVLWTSNINFKGNRCIQSLKVNKYHHIDEFYVVRQAVFVNWGCCCRVVIEEKEVKVPSL